MRGSSVTALAALVGALALAPAAHAGILSKASAQPGSAQGSAVDAGVAQVSHSQAARDDAGGHTASWSAVTVAGTSVLGRSSDGSWTGAASAGGPALDGASGVCVGDYDPSVCAGVLSAYSDCSAAGCETSGSAARASVRVAGGGTYVDVLGSGAYEYGGGDCSYTAAGGWLLWVEHGDGGGTYESLPVDSSEATESDCET